MAILDKNQDILSSQIQKLNVNFVNFTYMETDTIPLLLKSWQKDILQINSTVHYLSKELKALFHDRNFFIMFQLRSHLATLCNGINSVRIDTILILNQVSVISLQKLKPALLNPPDLMSLLTKLESQLVSHPRLALS